MLKFIINYYIQIGIIVLVLIFFLFFKFKKTEKLTPTLRPVFTECPVNTPDVITEAQKLKSKPISIVQKKNIIKIK